MAESHGGAEGTGAHTEADGGSGFPPFDPSTFPSQLVSLVIAFVALYLIVSRIDQHHKSTMQVEMLDATRKNKSRSRRCENRNPAYLRCTMATGQEGQCNECSRSQISDCPRVISALDESVCHDLQFRLFRRKRIAQRELAAAGIKRHNLPAAFSRGHVGNAYSSGKNGGAI